MTELTFKLLQPNTNFKLESLTSNFRHGATVRIPQEKYAKITMGSK